MAYKRASKCTGADGEELGFFYGGVEFLCFVHTYI